MKERKRERKKERKSERKKKWKKERMKDRMKERMKERKKERKVAHYGCFSGTKFILELCPNNLEYNINQICHGKEAVESCVYSIAQSPYSLSLVFIFSY